MPRMVTVGLQIPNFTYPGIDEAQLFPTVAAIAAAAEDNGFDSLFVMDHFFQLPMLGPPELAMFESYTLLGGLAAVTSSIQLGTLVTGVTYRHPGVLAKVVTTLDVVSRGRALLGIGAAWFELEHQALGVPFPPLRERFERLDDALRICRAMFDAPQATVAGTHHSVTEAWNVPRPVRDGGPPILVGGSGERKTFRLAAQHADLLNIISSFADLPRKLDALHGHLDDLGRERATIGVSCLGSIVVGRTAADAEEKLAGLLTSRGVDPAVLADPDTRARLLTRMFVGDPDQVTEQVRKVVASGLDGVIVNMPADAHDLDSVALAGRTLRDAIVR
jgi:F420-dependent oxidoreductase-like protein